MTDDLDNHYTSYTRDRKKCSGKNCTAMIPKNDDLCPKCYHLELVGKPPTTKCIQYVGGESIFD